jgi:hypothetical protein
MRIRQDTLDSVGAIVGGRAEACDAYEAGPGIMIVLPETDDRDGLSLVRYRGSWYVAEWSDRHAQWQSPVSLGAIHTAVARRLSDLVTLAGVRRFRSAVAAARWACAE